MNLFPNKKYQIIYADPPWDYKGWEKRKDKRFGFVGTQYNRMSFSDISSLPIQDICFDDCLLFLWVTFPFLQKGLDLIKCWGFEYKTCGFTWIKLTKYGHKIKPYGLGYYTKSNAEVVLIGRKGKYIVKRRDIQQIVISPIENHSKKPDEVRDRIVQLCGDLPRIELFARKKTKGWDVWGNEVERRVIKSNIV